MVKRVIFHIGAPKTGTTRLQSILWKNRQALGEDGVCYPLNDPGDYLPATVDLCERPWGGLYAQERIGAWDAIARRIREWPGDKAIFSSEIMGLATPEHAARAVESVQPAEVHLLLTVRDLARQVPSEWQEQVKHHHTVSWTRFTDDLIELGHDAPAPFGEMFWGLHDPVYVLDRWAGLVPREHMHLVTVPPSGSEDEVLWRRFAEATGLDPDRYDLDVPIGNTSMGAAEAEFLRRFHIVTQGRLRPEHQPVVNRLVGQRILTSSNVLGSIRLAADQLTWISQRSRQMRDEVASRGYHVVGDLDELLSDPPGPDYDPPPVLEDLSPRVMNQVAYHVVAELIDRILWLRKRVTRMEKRIAALQEKAQAPT